MALMRIHPPQRSTIRSSLLTSSIRPIQYRTTAPSSDPAVAAISTPVMVMPEVVVMNPPNGRMISEGIGGKIFSRASIMRMPA
ncbi:hypothetical protein D3C74_456620 [compost metagenome]